MKRTKIRQLWTDAAAFAGQTITVCGWGRTIRDMKNFAFLELNDGSAFNQPFELKADKIDVEGASSPSYPLQKKRHSVEYLRTIQHLRPRTNMFSAAFRVRSVAAQAVHDFFQSRGFVYVHTPIITGSDCEGAGEMFQVTALDLDNLPRTEDGAVRECRRRNRWRTPIPNRPMRPARAERASSLAQA